MKLSMRPLAESLTVMVALVVGQALIGSAKGADTTKSDSAKPLVAVFRLTGSILETPEDETLSLTDEKKTALKDLVEQLKKARDDKDVKAVVVTLDRFSIGGAQIEELRQALAEIRAAGKQVFAHADSLSLGHYLLVAGANEISVVPTGDLWLIGLHGESLYLRGMLNLMGVTPDFLTCGEYKSAAEIFMRESPSPQAEEMMNWILDSYYDTAVKIIADGRGMDVNKVKQLLDEGPYNARRAKEAGLIDKVQHRQEFEAAIKQRFDGNAKFDSKYGKKDDKQFDLSTPMGILSFYAELLGGKKIKPHKDSVAIVYVEGPIVLGNPPTSVLESDKTAASTPLRKALNKAAADDTIKAVVLRINSPGGSAVASEIILDATKRVKAKKPLVVSMGNVAGSGGYYVACGADTIFADDLTLTGSIGVVAGKLATTDMWNKIGINWKEYDRGANAALLSSGRVFTPEQRKTMQDWMDEVYDVFKGHVTAIRGDRLKKPIDDIAGGRVYTGRQALELGLVDKIGSLEDAVKFAAGEAKLDKYELRVVPEPKNILEKLMENLTGGDEDEDKVTLVARGGPFGAGAGLMSFAAPYLRDLDPHRVDVLLRSLRQLETLNKEGVSLMMPEILIGEPARK